MIAFDWREELETVLQNHGVANEEVCLVGSFPMFVAGIRECRDIDLVATPAARARITTSEKTAALSPRIYVNAKDWARLVSSDSVSLTDQEVVGNPRYHTIFEGFKVMRLELLFSVKLARGRDKDVADVRLIEQYALESPDWDWGLVRACVDTAQKEACRPSTVRPNHLSRVVHVFALGRRALANPRAALAFVRAAIIQCVRSRRGREEPDARPTPHLKSQLLTMMPTAALLGDQYADGEFLRYDVLLRYLAVQSIVHGSEELTPHYMRMQNERVRVETCDSLRELVASIQERGFLSRYPIPVTEEGLILDGAHRLACALYFDVAEVAVVVRPVRTRVYYRRQWFLDHGFDPELVGLLDRTKDALFEKHGVWFPVILWPPVQPWFDEITQEIGSRFVVKWQKTIELGNAMPAFARRVYAIDDIERWKVELKIHAMQQYQPLIKVLALEIPDPGFRPKMRTQTYLSAVGATLKKWIRDSYRDKVPGYYYDIVCHTGDNHQHNRAIFQIVHSLRGEG